MIFIIVSHQIKEPMKELIKVNLPIPVCISFSENIKVEAKSNSNLKALVEKADQMQMG